MRPNALTSFLCVALLALGSGCGDSDDTGGTDTGGTDTTNNDTVGGDTVTGDTTGDTGTGDTGGDVVTPAGTPFIFIDFLTTEAIVGATVTYGSDTFTTDATGTAYLEIPPDSWYEFTLTGTGFRDHYFGSYLPANVPEIGYTVATDATVAAFETILGVTVDDTKALMSVVARRIDDNGDVVSIPDMTIGVNVASDLTLVFDAASATGLSAGNVTLADSSSTAVFVNVEAGDVSPTFVHADGYLCEGARPIDAPAGSYVVSGYLCYTGIVFGFSDFLTGEVMAGATVTYDGTDYTTNAAGNIWLDDGPDNAFYDLKISGAGFRDHFIHTYLPTGNRGQFYSLATDATVAAVATIFGTTIDDTKGILAFGMRTVDGAGLFGIEGMTVELDAAYDLAVARDSSTAAGLTVGTTTLADSPAGVIFANVDAGDVTPTFGHADDYQCEGTIPVTVPAGGFVISDYTCYTGLRFTIADFLTQAPLVGATVTHDGTDYITNPNGNVYIEVAGNSWYDLKVTGDGFRDHYINNYHPTDGVPVFYAIATDATVAAIETLLGLTVDDTKGLLSLAIRELDGNLHKSIEGMTVTLDVASDVTVVADAASATGLSAGNTSLVGSTSNIISANVVAGDVTPTFVHVDGYQCEGNAPIDMKAGTFNTSGYICYTGQRFKLTDFLTGQPLPNATLTYDGTDYISNANGNVYIEIDDNVWYDFDVKGDGMRDHFIHGFHPAGGEPVNYSIATDTTIAAIQTLLGLTVDDTKGLLSIAVRQLVGAAQTSVAGMTVTLDAASDISLVSDASSGTGLSPGFVTLDGSSSTVINANVIAGDVTPTFAHADGYTCNGTVPVNVPAGSFVISTYLCHSGTPVTLIDFLSREPLAGLTVKLGAQEAVTNALGQVYLDFTEDASYALEVTGAGTRDHFIYDYKATGDDDIAYTIATDATIAAFQVILGLTVDDAKGLLSIAARNVNPGAASPFIPNMTLGIDAAAALQLVFDSGSATGLSPGAVTLAASSSTSIFVNADAGNIVPSFIHTDGYTCVGESPVTLPAGSYVISMYRCTTTQ